MAENRNLLLKASNSVLLLVDIQERFRPVVAEMEEVIRRSAVLLRAALRLEVPVLVSEQYPKALGETVTELRQWMTRSQAHFDKLCFSATDCLPWMDALHSTGRKQALLCGVEAHVCVLQTALHLLSEGYSVFMAVDAVSSRKSLDKGVALRRLEKHGVQMVTTEMAVFEWLRKAGTAEFKELQALVK